MDYIIERKIMKQIIIAIFSLSIFLPVCGQDALIFEQAQQLFEQKQYAQACKLYDRIDDKGFVVVANMALCYAQQGNAAQALLYAKRAAKQATIFEYPCMMQLLEIMYKQIDPQFEFT